MSYSKKLKTQALRVCQEVSNKYYNDALGWVSEYISFPDGKGPTPQQKEILKALSGDRFVVASGGGGIGKTATAVWAGLWGLTAHPEAAIGVTAPVGPQLESVLWPEFDVWLSRCSLSPVIKYTYRSITIKGFAKWSIFKRVAQKEKKDVSDTLAGLHGPWVLYIVDEAAGVRTQVFTAIDGAMTQEESRALLISNPTSGSGYFYDTLQGDMGYKVLQFSALDSPLVTPEYEKNIIQRWGKDSPMYRIKVLGLPTDESAFAVVSPSTFDEVVGANKRICGGDIVAGIDPGGEGVDPTICCISQGDSLIDWWSFSESDPDALAYTFIRRLESLTSRATVIVDAVGIGFGLYKALERLSPFKVIKYEGSSASDHPEMFYPRRAQVYWKLREDFPNLQFPTPPPERLKKELANLRFDFDPKGRISMESKKKFRSRMGFSPNNADALSLTRVISAFSWAIKPDRMAGVRTLDTMVLGDNTYGQYGRFM